MFDVIHAFVVGLIDAVPNVQQASVQGLVELARFGEAIYWMMACTCLSYTR